MPSFTDSTSTGAGCTCGPCNTGAGVLGARAIIVGPHPPPFYTSSLNVTHLRAPDASQLIEMLK